MKLQLASTIQNACELLMVNHNSV